MMGMEQGPRMKHLRLALHKMLQAAIKNCTGPDRIEQCFPFGLTSEQLVLLDGLLREQLNRVGEDMQGPFEELLRKYDLSTKLDEIDNYLQSHSTGTKEIAETEEKRNTAQKEKNQDIPIEGTGNDSNTLKNCPNVTISSSNGESPHELIATKLLPAKMELVANLRNQLAHLKERNHNRLQLLTVRRAEIQRRIDHLQDTKQLYDAAFDQVTGCGIGELETLVDRMAHQTVPSSANPGRD